MVTELRAQRDQMGSEIVSLRQRAEVPPVEKVAPKRRVRRDAASSKTVKDPK